MGRIGDTRQGITGGLLLTPFIIIETTIDAHYRTAVPRMEHEGFVRENEEFTLWRISIFLSSWVHSFQW